MCSIFSEKVGKKKARVTQKTLSNGFSFCKSGYPKMTKRLLAGIPGASL